MNVKVTASIDCKVANSSDAHSLGREIEERLVTAINNLIPNLRSAQQIQEGVVHLSMEVTGRRLRIQNTGSTGQDRLQVEGVEGGK